MNVRLVHRSCVIIMVLASSHRANGAEPYCGVYCTFCAVRICSTNVDLNELIDKRYVPSEKGSSVDDICRAVREHGAYANPFHGIGEASLRASADPVILHVRRPGYNSDFDHWVLYLGNVGSDARILDPPGETQEVPFSELLAVSDGIGIVVSSHPNSGLALRAGTWLELGTTLIILSVAIDCARGLLPRLARARWAGIVWITMAVVMGVTLYWGKAGATGRSVWAASGEVARRYFEANFPVMTNEALRKLIGKPGVTIVDCRLPAAFERGHVSGSINLPVNANTADRARILEDVPLSDQLVVYCQSEFCVWSHQLAGDLFHRGYRNVATYPGGWVDWVRHERQPANSVQ